MKPPTPAPSPRPRDRRAFMRDLEAGPTGAGTLVGLDVDVFKGVNDTLGHARDELLRDLGAHLAGAFAGGRGYRLGGDEFAVLTPEECPGALHRTAEGVEDALRRAGHLTGLSAGHARFPAEASTARELLTVADERMYARKRHRRSGPATAEPLPGEGPGGRWSASR